MKVGIEYRDYPRETIREVILDAANQEVPKLEKHLPALGTISYIAPLLGLLGTVVGNIEAFGVLGRFGAVGDPGLLAKGIAEALLTTAAGIIVAIPAVIFYNHLVSKVNHMIIRLENRVNELVLLLHGKPELKQEVVEPVVDPFGGIDQ
jgi:biopolymer transport protein ExbB